MYDWNVFIINWFLNIVLVNKLKFKDKFSFLDGNL